MFYQNFQKKKNQYESTYSLFIKTLIKCSSGNINESLSIFRQGYKQLNDNIKYIYFKINRKKFYFIGKI